ncbi:hypothetical protein [Aquimarina celericrescens]|uniref:Lipoprotein n=1 Tax=Aquimarina celericrescens TaxID=1964542 RepID=A0ABW5AVW3_9FLAO|nr:hypothetical protein [Aquimarina celericrescens]
MKKTVILFLAAILTLGIQSCTLDEQEEIISQDFSVVKEGKDKNVSMVPSTCYKIIYIDYGNMSLGNRRLFKLLAAEAWFSNSVFELKSLCPSIEIWKVPCDMVYYTKNEEEEDIVIDAEESLTIGEGGAPIPPHVDSSPVYQTGNSFDYSLCQETTGDDPDINPIDPDHPDDDNLPITNIP